MDDLYFYDFEFNLLHILSQTVSVNYSIYYNKIGNAELHMPVMAKVINLLNNDLFVLQGDIQWMVTGFKISGSELIIFGRTLNYLMSKRCVIPFATIHTDPENLVRQLVTNAYMVDRSSFTLKDGRTINICDSSGNTYTLSKQSNFELAPIIGDTFAQSDYRRDTGQALSDCVIDYLNYINCGHNIIADVINKKWIFKAYKGEIRQLILSEQNRNCSDVEKTVEKQDFASCGFFEKTNTTTTGDTNSNSDTASDWIYVPGTISEIPILRFEAVLSGQNKSEAESSLKSKKIKSTINSKIMLLKYGVDYSLGDVFKVNYVFDGLAKTATVRVVSININYEKDILEVVPELEDIDD